MNESGGGAGANSSYGRKVAAAVAAAATFYFAEQNKKRRPSAAQEGAANGLAHAAVPAKPSAAAAAPPAASALQHSSTALTTAARPSLQGVPAPTSTGGSPLTLSSAASGSPNTSRSVSPVLPSVPRRVSLSGSASGSAPVAHPSRRVALFDFYLGKRMSVTVNELAQVVLPYRLLHVVLRFRAQRLGQPLSLPPDYRQLEITPLQLQRFLRGCVLSISHALTAPPACVLRLVPTTTKRRWIDCIFMRVMSGFAARAMQTLAEVQAIRAAAAARIAGKPNIFSAAHTGDIELVLDHLTAVPATANEKTANFRTPLHFAAEEGHKEICKVLVAAKADVAATCWLGYTPLKYAMTFNKSYVVSYLQSIDAPHCPK